MVVVVVVLEIKIEIIVELTWIKTVSVWYLVKKDVIVEVAVILIGIALVV